MEVGAVKQAFNNEVILLKNNLKQAKIQVIHKLTRKAKTLTEKKGTDALKEKFKRKAEMAVKEVLLIKKIKVRDIARFIVTHSRQLNEYLNKPNVDENKACARLLLHKSMTNKYKLIRGKFANVSINDLLMSRQERRKLKKEAREKQKNKNKKQNVAKTDNVGGVWDVEINETFKLGSVEKNSNSEFTDTDNESDSENENIDELNVEEQDSDQSEKHVEDKAISNGMLIENYELPNENNKQDIKNCLKKSNINMKDNKKSRISNDSTKNRAILPSSVKKTTQMEYEDESCAYDKNVYKQSNDKDMSDNNDDRDGDDHSSADSDIEHNKVIKNNSINQSGHIKLSNRNKSKKLKDSSKNKNLNEKLVNRNFKKKSDNENIGQMTKMPDPFFVTATGENYMSLVEPRQPDEVKEVHKQGNRQYRRAVLFGHVPKKPRNTGYKAKNTNQSSNYINNNKSFNKTNSVADENRQLKNKDPKNNNSKDEIPEKLHPSWEAKKRQSTIVPFKGKKIMFDDS